MRKIYRVNFKDIVVDVEAENAIEACELSYNFLTKNRNYIPSIQVTELKLIAEPLDLTSPTSKNVVEKKE